MKTEMMNLNISLDNMTSNAVVMCDDENNVAYLQMIFGRYSVWITLDGKVLASDESEEGRLLELLKAVPSNYGGLIRTAISGNRARSMEVGS